MSEIDRATRPFRLPAGNINVIRDALLDGNWENAGIIRTREKLERANEMLDALSQDLQRTGVPDGDRAFNLTWSDWLNLENQILTSQAIVAGALRRENSRGAHFREDFPDAGDLPTSRFTLVELKDGAICVDDAPVDFAIVKPGETLLKDVAE